MQRDLRRFVFWRFLSLWLLFHLHILPCRVVEIHHYLLTASTTLFLVLVFLSHRRNFYWKLCSVSFFLSYKGNCATSTLLLSLIRVSLWKFTLQWLPDLGFWIPISEWVLYTRALERFTRTTVSPWRLQRVAIVDLPTFVKDDRILLLLFLCIIATKELNENWDQSKFLAMAFNLQIWSKSTTYSLNVLRKRDTFNYYTEF